MAGLAILKHIRDLIDEDRIARAWVENPYYQLFCTARRSSSTS